jgi:hypothetical protein
MQIFFWRKKREMPPRRFPPPWTVAETDALLCNHGGQARAYGAFIRGSFAPG